MICLKLDGQHNLYVHILFIYVSTEVMIHQRGPKIAKKTKNTKALNIENIVSWH
jgi:hypothetical protein